MKFDESSLLLYAVTDRRRAGPEGHAAAAEKALRGGVTFLQLREKDLDEEALLQEARLLKPLCEKYGVPFVVNDNIPAALKAGADGAHVGQKDLEAGRARELLGPNKILGVSVQTPEQAVAAEAAGADYLGVGAVFPTGSKDDAELVSPETLREICRAVRIPVVAIGGIDERNVEKLAGTGIAGVAVISAIFGRPDVFEAARVMKAAASRVCRP